MNIDYSVLSKEEIAVFKLRSIYKKHGYSHFKMSKFEEYDLYARNKDFLVSDNVITFNDTDGKLLALKPDVTLSIIKNTKDGETRKLYYDENVYRVSGSNGSFKEIMQAGLECIGEINEANLSEVILLAAKSLEAFSDDYVLDITHLGIISALTEALNISGEAKKEVIKCISEKNLHGIDFVCESENADKEALDKLKKLVALNGSASKVIPQIEEILKGEYAEFTDSLSAVTEGFGDDDKIRIDFSVISDMNYYNGIVFKGFINGIPSGILSGGQYDKLMKKLRKNSCAAGFAVYLDMLELLGD